MSAEVAGKHNGSSDFYKLGRLKLTDAGNLDPGALAVNPQTNSRNENRNEQQQTEDIKRRSYIQEFPIIVKGDQEHGHYADPQADELLHPKIFSWLGIANLDRAKTHDADRQQRQQPVEIA